MQRPDEAGLRAALEGLGAELQVCQPSLALLSSCCPHRESQQPVYMLHSTPEVRLQN